MSINTTTRPINLAQLDEELRIAANLDEPPGLSAATSETATGLTETQVVCEHDAITQTLLDDAIDAHVPATPKTVHDVETVLAMVRELSDIVMEL